MEGEITEGVAQRGIGLSRAHAQFHATAGIQDFRYGSRDMVYSLLE